MSSSASVRAGELGRLGAGLYKLIPTLLFRTWPTGVSRQATAIEAPPVSGLRSLQKVAISVLLCDVVMQVKTSDSDLLNLADLALEPLPNPLPAPIYLGKKPDGQPTFPSKPATAAEKKVNLRFGDIYRESVRHRPTEARRFSQLSGCLVGLTDDQATCALLAAHALAGYSGGIDLAVRIIRDPAGSKVLSSVLKSLGANGTKLGSCLVEGDTLQGRGVGLLNLREKARERTSAPGSAGALPRIDARRLRESVRKVIQSELGGRQVVFEDPVDFWNRRWEWCVNGGHSRAMEKHDPVWTVAHKGRVHRRVAMEEWTRNPLDHWRGEVYVSASEKMECGKTRMILACDTLSYVCFEHLLRPVEVCWQNRRVLLDPGKYGHSGMADRVLEIVGKDGLALMLDYDDFNSQHTLEAQKIVIEELGTITGYPQQYLQRLVQSFDRMHVYAGADGLGLATATLMSGHRGTTFINSVLNAAYLDVATDGLTSSLPAAHTGDDIVMGAKSYTNVEKIIQGCRACGLRMNPVKQSVGTISAEFLRMAIKRHSVRGYFMRAAASTVAGNWVNPDELTGRALLTTYVSCARTLMNRGYRKLFGVLMLTSARRRLDLPRYVLKRLLTGEVALPNGPVFSTGGQYTDCSVSEVKPEVNVRESRLVHHATQSYLTYSITDVERHALERARLSPVNHMVDSSYAKTLHEEGMVTKPERVQVFLNPARTALGKAADWELWSATPPPGALERFPLLHLIRNQLTNDDIIELLEMVGWNGEGDPDLVAWGRQADGAVVTGTASYSDACMLAQRSQAGIVSMSRPCFV